MSIPRVGEWLEEVEYVELGEEEARALVQKYNKQGRDAGFGNLSHNQRRDFRSNRFNRFPPNRRTSPHPLATFVLDPDLHRSSLRF